ncbi:MAG: toll/interleukin-1 receptor domain-containing protein [Anaerolineae bacterium]|nr:toll/interleukin-1 receptor domain-containing protein [Anaerolineae bacterium]
MQVFISYKREDLAFARRLDERLRTWGCETWLDVDDIPYATPGKKGWDDAVFAGLKASDVVIGVMTPESVTSKNVLDEWDYADRTAKSLMLLMLRSVPEKDIPFRYGRIQRISFVEDEEHGFIELRRAIAELMGVGPEKLCPPPPPRSKLPKHIGLPLKIAFVVVLAVVTGLFCDAACPINNPIKAAELSTATPTVVSTSLSPTETLIPTPQQTPAPMPTPQQTLFPAGQLKSLCKASKFEGEGGLLFLPDEQCDLPGVPDAARLTWDVSRRNSFAGCKIQLPPDLQVVGGATHLVFWAQGETGGEQFRVSLIDAGGNEWRENIQPLFEGAQRIVIPLSTFEEHEVDLDNLEYLTIGASYHLDQEGSVCIGGFGFGTP